MNISDFTQPEIRFLLAECNFTEEQEKFFLLRCKNISIEECAEKLAISVSTANLISKKVKSKIIKVL